jgi:hypothetical protein
MIAEVGNYTFPDKIGFKGWVAFGKAIAFENLDGQVVVVKKPDD